MQFKNTAMLALACVMTATLGLPQGASAQDKADAAKQEQKAEPPKRDQKALDYEKAVKDLVKSEGAFTFYRRKKDLLLELPEDKLGKLFLVQAAFHNGFSEDPVQAGSPIGGQAVDAYRLERHDDEVWLIRPNLRYRWDANDPLAEASARSMPEAILADYPIEQTNPETKRVLVNITPLLNGDLNQLGLMVSILGGSQYGLDRDKSGVDRIMQSADITTVRMKMTYFTPRPGGMENPFAALLGGMVNQAEDARSLPLKITWTLQWRPEKSSYMPRLADPRVGYFTQDYYSVDRFYKMDRTQRYINRWNLVKKDPKAAMSEPVKPIVWTIDNSIPEKYRPAVRSGILRWNKSFEALGFKNAVQVVDAPTNDPDYDHADGRRNVVRFTMTEAAGYAIALFRTDPFTGEIINAGVNIDANFVNYVGQEYLRSTVPSASGLKATLDLAKVSLTSSDPKAYSPRDLMLHRDVLRDQIAGREMRKLGWTPFFCNYGAEVMQDAAVAFRATKAAGMSISGDKFIENYMADVVCHEVGHCMGLRHNFVASTNLSTAELADSKKVADQQVAASVMDYTPTNIVAVLNNNASAMHNSGVGPYDNFAIRYGYADIAAQTPEGERFGLSQIAKRGGEKGNAYMSDEDADGVDPFVVRFDLAKDPLNYADKEMLAMRKTRRWAIANLPLPGESYFERNSLVLNTLQRQFGTAMGATVFITGVVGNRNFRGDVNEQPTLRPVDPALARQAMNMIITNVLGFKSLDIPDSVLNNLSLDYNDGSGNQFTAPVRTIIAMNQMLVLSQLLSVQGLNQIQENQFKMSNNPAAYTLDEHLGLISDSVFGDIPSSASIPSLRRELQSFALETLIAQASTSGLQAEVRRVASDAVSFASAKVNSRLRNRMAIDKPTSSHLQNMAKMIARYESRQMVVTGP